MSRQVAVLIIDLTCSVSTLMDCSLVSPAVQCLSAVSYILFSFVIYKKRMSGRVSSL